MVPRMELILSLMVFGLRVDDFKLCLVRTGNLVCGGGAEIVKSYEQFGKQQRPFK